MADPTDAPSPEDPWPEPSGDPAPPAPAASSRTARARAQAEHLRTRADETVKALESKRPANRWIDAGFATFERDVTSGGGVLAAALAFRLFIFMVPFVFVIVTAIPTASGAADADPTEVADKFGMTGLVATAIKSADNISTWNRLWLLIAGIVALVLAGRSLVRVLRITHGLAWHARVPKLRRPTLASLVLIGAIFCVVLFGAWTSKLQDQVGILGLLPILLAGFVLAAVWTFIQYHLPRADVHWTKLIPGSVLVALGVEVLQIVTVVWFTRYIESKSETYGAIGAALAILLWAYFLGRIVVSGAMLNAALYEQEQREAP
ncbi:MAG: YhjD/YihY/BrkB family envelope integrity protein [Acidimicrobiia bacterium]